MLNKVLKKDGKLHNNLGVDRWRGRFSWSEDCEMVEEEKKRIKN
jgi:hypothetical protein